MWGGGGLGWCPTQYVAQQELGASGTLRNMTWKFHRRLRVRSHPLVARRSAITAVGHGLFIA